MLRPRRVIAFVGVVTVVALVIAALLPPGDLVVHVSAKRTQPAGALPWLSITGRRLVDGSGRTVLLHGFDSDALVEYPDGIHHTLTDSDAALMQRSGFNVVRLAISWSLLEPTRGRVNSAYMDVIQRTVAMLNRHGLYAVLDMHFQPAFSPRFGGAGAPRWAAVPAVPGFEGSSNYWLRQVLTPDALAAYLYFVTSSDWQRDYLMVWRAVAQRFQDSPGVAGYDLLNEPHPFPVPPDYFEKYWLWPFYGRIIDAIGSVDANHIFIVDNSMFSNIPTITEHVIGAQVLYAPHVYYGVFGFPTSSTGAASIGQYIRSVNAEAARIPAPLWVGETSIDSTYPDALRWIMNSLNAYDDLGAGWAWWQWEEDSNWGLKGSDGTIKWGELRLLARPYLAAAPEGVTLVGEAATNHLEFTASPERGAGAVEVAWAANLIGHPSVRSTCASSWHWDAARARVVITLEAGVPCTVTIGAR